MGRYKLIALDLDGTLLDSEKRLTTRAAQTLSRAAARGIEIVPTTGRFYDGMPESVRSLAFVRYAITINGAQVLDAARGETLCRAEIPLAQALDILHWLDDYPVIYDCYMDGWGWMTRAQQEKAAEFAPDEHYRDMLRQLRTPVDELKEFLRTKRRDVQKIQFFAQNMSLRERLMKELPVRFADIAVSSSVRNNVEINQRRATKGDALAALCERLGIDCAETIAFGDGNNDLSMICRAGLGVAMGNALPEVRAAADVVTGDCDHDGVAEAIEKYCL